MAHYEDSKAPTEATLSDAVKKVGVRARELEALLSDTLSLPSPLGESKPESKPQNPNRIRQLRDDLLNTAAILECCQKCVRRELVQQL